MSDWLYTDPKIAWYYLFIASVTSISPLLTLASPGIESLNRRVFIPFLTFIWVMFGALTAWTGPRSGWRGLWILRVPATPGDVAEAVGRALDGIGVGFERTLPVVRPPRLRKAEVVFEFRDGVRVWFLRGAWGLPAIRPFTTIAIQGLRGPKVPQGEPFRAFLRVTVFGA